MEDVGRGRATFGFYIGMNFICNVSLLGAQRRGNINQSAEQRQKGNLLEGKAHINTYACTYLQCYLDISESKKGNPLFVYPATSQLLLALSDVLRRRRRTRVESNDFMR